MFTNLINQETVSEYFGEEDCFLEFYNASKVINYGILMRMLVQVSRTNMLVKCKGGYTNY